MYQPPNEKVFLLFSVGHIDTLYYNLFCIQRTTIECQDKVRVPHIPHTYPTPLKRDEWLRPYFRVNIVSLRVA